MAAAGLIMGFALTLLYILTAYLSPTLLFGELAQYHFEVILAVLALLASLPSLPGSGISRAPQTYAIAGMGFAILASFVFAGLARDAPSAFYEFLPDSFAFFLVALNCRTRRRLQLVVLTLVIGSGVFIVLGALALHAGAIVSPYLYDQGYEGNHIMRLRGLGIVNDPNDFAQVLVSLIPCTFLSWKPKRFLWNGAFVLFPCAFLLVGVFLTHSRGSVVALMAVIALAVYRRFGAIPAAVMAGAIFALSSALSWSGGRDISVESGADRMDAWSVGLELIKSHPIFGVGYRRFTEYNNITAHNTIVVCAAELGFIGFFFWVLFVLSSVRESLLPRRQKSSRVREESIAEESIAPSYAEFPLRYAGASDVHPNAFMRISPSPLGQAESTGATESIGDAESTTDKTEPLAGFAESAPPRESEAAVRQMAWIMVLCFTGFFVAGWFLSRAYVMWLFVYGGMAHVVYRMAVDRGIAPPPITFPRLLKLAFYASLGLLLFVYIILRLRNLLPASSG